ncbi:DUF397 domain-containing protein [Streptomyces sp. H10-C2]|uniref:DUF397 domain-containing protein n=1 Tax=unclassified Streptomyces TaxID=2593676 RepID=UPI0024BB366D|nr:MULTISPECIES: DUF397 domain-containing protein [unclassified Streptomyces]MDJ0342675.1 DUF397 domain-containing protein [Streptomyces sp. PH10-H1]MDJ0372616.1 DUF397 domain-containing protein [Streptomyces sp. H10-C2]
MSQLRWQKSSFSEGGAANCVELAAGPAGTPHLRESDDPARVVTTTPAALRAFLRAVKSGKLDGLAG